MAKMQNENPLAELEKAYAHWQELYEHGGSDPFYADGVGLNLVRHHIIYYKRQIEESCPLYMADEIYQRELPPKVDPDYMVGVDKIRKQARQSLQVYLDDPNYQYLLRRRDRLTVQQIRGLSVDSVLGYVAGLQMAIDSDDLLVMRLHRDGKHYLESFKSCAERVKTALEGAEPNLFAMAAEDEGMEQSM